ncbi:MAG TPA: cytochrome c biogenesis protein CcdA [Ktedonobacterales bacterium]|nr:cytochrome c biogenesis protein CcdA [Ktedonobacterales bacterium]
MTGSRPFLQDRSVKDASGRRPSRPRIASVVRIKLRAALTAVAFSLGCITCFGGAIVGTLLIYIGSAGSAEIGAAIMLTFSAGIAIPFFAAALAVSQAGRLAHGLDRMRPWAGFVASVVMAAFALVLMTDNFHVLSDFIYPLLHLPTR